MRLSVYEDEDLHFSIEDTPTGWFCHCDVKKWSKEKYLKFIDILVDTLLLSPNRELWVLADNPKLVKFSMMMGFESFDTVQHQGKTMELLKLC